MSILSRARPLMLSRLASAGLTFFIPLVLARELTPEEYGTYKQAWLVASTLYFVLQLGLAQSLYYFLPREPQKRALYLTQASLCLAALGAVAGAALDALGPQLGRYFGNQQLPPLAPWIALTTFFLVAGAPYDVALTASGRMGLSGAVRVLVDIARTVGLVVPAWWFHSLRGLVLGLAWSSALRLVITWWVVLRAGRPTVTRADLRWQLGYALPFGAAVALAIPQQQFHQYAVGAMATTAAFAVYSVGGFQLPVVDLLYAPVSDVLQIRIAHFDGQGRPGDAAGLFREAVAQLAFVFVPVVVFALVSAPELISLLFTTRYADAAPIFRVGVLVVPLSALPLEGVLRARAQRRFFLWVCAAKLAITVALVLGLLRLLGPIGAMAGYVASEAAAKAMMLSHVARLFRVPVRRALPLPSLRAYAVAALVAAPPAWFLATQWRHMPGRLLSAVLVSGVAFGAIYLAVLTVTGRLPTLDFLRVRPGRPLPGAALSSPAESAVGRR